MSIDVQKVAVVLYSVQKNVVKISLCPIKAES